MSAFVLPPVWRPLVGALALLVAVVGCDTTVVPPPDPTTEPTPDPTPDRSAGVYSAPRQELPDHFETDPASNESRRVAASHFRF